MTIFDTCLLYTSYAISEVERIRKPELAGGALLDVGVYTINFASMVLGDKLKDVQATAIFREGVDMLDTIAMVFEGDRMATLQCRDVYKRQIQTCERVFPDHFPVRMPCAAVTHSA